ncbi:AsmA family protein [Halomonas sp. SH5A2]|uniref:AsmA family protein n=1 Tax=Halomonas sp. SH5A2 TaxID=2749040 RepID=UPI001641E965|nr:AsmA family protein [Halomonas sp. SH5A2]QNI01787.1 AsmA family protein [Halomonas sp. SH5A2]
MRQLLRIVLAAIGILAIVAVAAVVYVTTFLDPEDFKPRLTAVVEEQTGLNLDLDGPINWSFYPRIGVSVETANARLPSQGEEDTVFAAVDRAEVSVAFAPLLRGEIAVDGLTLNGVRLNLQRNADGEGNWESLLDRLLEQSEEAETVLAPASAGPNVDAGNLEVVLSIANVNINEANIRFRDEQSQALWHVRDLNVSGSNVNPVRAFPLKAMFTLTKHNNLDAEALERAPNISSDIGLETRMQLGLSEQRFVLENTQLSTRTRFEAEGEPQQLDVSAAEATVRLAEQQLSIRNGTLETSLRHPENWDGGLALALAFALEGDWQAQTAQFKDLQLTGPDDLRVSGHLNVSQLRDAPEYQGQLTAAPFTLRPWLARAGVTLETASEAALSDVAMTSPFEGDLQEIAFPSLSLIVDDSTFTGNIASRLDGSRIEFDLQGDALNLDRYLPRQETQQQASLGVINAAVADSSGELLPQAWLTSSSVNGDLNIESLELAGMAFSDARLQLQGEQGQHQLSNFEAGFYEGELTANGRIDATQDELQWALSPTIQNVQVAPLIETLSEGEEASPLRGRLNLSGDLTSRGNQREVLLRHLNGDLKARLTEGAILDINVSQEMCELAAQLEGEEIQRDWSSDTAFDEFAATLQIRGGVVQSDDLLITVPGIDVQGEGEYDLTSQRFDTQANARLVDTADAACEVNPRLEALPLPLRCEGHISDARGEWCRFDRAAFQGAVVELIQEEAGGQVSEALEKRLGESLDSLDERLGEGSGNALREGLQRLFD